MTIRVLLVDDHAIMREGLRAILEKHPEVEVVGEADNGRSAVELFGRLSPDVVIMDIGMRDFNGVEATRRIVASDRRARVIALSMHSDRQFVLEMLEAGASAYVLKTNASSELNQALAAVAGGNRYLSPDVAGAVVDGYVGRLFPDAHSPRSLLGRREREVLQLLAEGRTGPEVAQRLGLSVHTVAVHRRNIMRKLGLHTVAEPTKYAVREGLTPG